VLARTGSKTVNLSVAAALREKERKRRERLMEQQRNLI